MLGALLPQVKPKCEFFYFVRLPFLEDVRPYEFMDIFGDQNKHKPNQQQLDATDKLIEMMDISEPLIDADGYHTTFHPPL